LIAHTKRLPTLLVHVTTACSDNWAAQKFDVERCNLKKLSEVDNFHIHTVHLDIIKVFLFTNWWTSEMS